MFFRVSAILFQGTHPYTNLWYGATVKRGVIFVTTLLEHGNMSNQPPAQALEDAPHNGLSGDYTILLAGTSSETEKLAEALKSNNQADSGYTITPIVEPALDAIFETTDIHTLDCVVSEYNLEIGTGLDVLTRIRETAPNLPFFLWPESGSDTIASKAVEHDVTAYLPRHIDNSSYVSLHKRILDVLDQPLSQPSSPNHDPSPIDGNRADFFYDKFRELGGAGIFELDPSTWTLYLYNGLAGVDDPSQVTGESLDDILGYVHLDDREDVKDAARTALTQNEPQSLQCRISDMESTSRIVQTYVEPIANPESDHTWLRGIVWDLTEEIARRKALEAVNEAIYAALQVETVEEAAQVIADSGEHVYELAGPYVYLYNEEAGELQPIAHPQHSSQGPPASHAAGDSALWEVFQERDSKTVSTNREDLDLGLASDGIDEVLATTIGGYGVLVAGFRDPMQLDEFGLDFLNTLTSTAEVAVSQVRQMQEIRESEAKSQQRAEEYDRLNQLNAQIRSINRMLMEANSHSEINQSVCDAIVEGFFDFAWIGEPDYAAGELDVAVQSDVPSPYLTAVDFGLDAESPPPAVSAAERRAPVFEPNIAGGVQDEPWKSKALENDYRCALSIPLLYDSVLYGVLTVYTSDVGVIDDMMMNTLAELGEMVGFAHQTVSQQDALVGSNNIELTLTVDTEDDPFVRLADQLESQVEVRNITTRTDDTYLVFVTVEDVVSLDEVESALANSPLVEDYRAVTKSDSPMYEAVMYRESELFELADVGAELAAAIVSGEGLTLRVSVPREDGVQGFVDRVRTRNPGVTIHAQRKARDIEGREESISSPFDVLTDRQREILDAAYYSGYFETPRDSSASEIAESLDMSQPGFSKQRRAAIRRLLEIVYQ